jgi:GNAT superfamily N-acetyltransferase
VRVRAATIADAGPIARVHIASWRAAYVGLIPQDFLDAMDVEDRRLRWEGIFAADRWPTGAFVLEADTAPDAPLALATALAPGGESEPARSDQEGRDASGDVIGFVHYGPSRDPGDDPQTVGSVNALYLVPPVWRAGGGRALLEAAERELRRAGFATATLWVLSGNERAARFYERQGWHHDGVTNDRDWGTFVARELRYRTTW